LRDYLSRTTGSCLGFCFCSCTQDKFVMRVKPGYAHLHAIKILHHDKFLVPRQIIPPLLTAFARGRCDTRNAHKNLYLDGKNCAIPSLHRDNFLAKVPGPVAGWASGNRPPLHSGSPLKRGRLSLKLLPPKRDRLTRQFINARTFLLPCR
jgi:hypothetical protein